MAISDVDKFRANSLKAGDYGSPPYNWIPPVWEPGAAPPKLEDTAAKDPNFPSARLKCDRDAEERPGQEQLGAGHGWLTKWPHPCSDFTHIDPEDFDENDFNTTRGKLGASSNEFLKLKKFVGPESLGMQRLALVFELTLCRLSALLADLNSTLLGRPQPTGPDQVKYALARE